MKNQEYQQQINKTANQQIFGFLDLWRSVAQVYFQGNGGLPTNLINPESLQKLRAKARSALPNLATTLADSEYSVRAVANNAISATAPEFFTKRARP